MTGHQEPPTGPARAAVVDLPAPTVGSVAAAPMRVVLDWGRRYVLWVSDVGLACCSLELMSALMGRPESLERGAVPLAAGPGQVDVLVVSGTCTDTMAPTVKRAYDRLPEPRYVISFGACASTGGPYWDSYCVTKGVDQIIPVDVYVPGCPPRPEALLQGLLLLADRITTEQGEDALAEHRPPVPGATS